MTETTHTRSRRCALGGLVVQLAVFAAALAVGLLTHSEAAKNLAWYVLGGLLPWFTALLVFRQHELAELEALDLAELRRERSATGGGEALFEEGGAGALGFRVAEARLRWMQRWVIPGLGLAQAAYLATMGILLWNQLQATRIAIGSEKWAPLTNLPVALIVLGVALVGAFWMSRYTSGLARVSTWQLLRGCGSYLLGNTIVFVLLIVCLGVVLYANVATWEHALAMAIPIVMVVLAAEILFNFVLDIYRPRTPGVEPRACFDSRLLGLIAEPGGIAHTIAEAINYQFGVKVSHTWFYQLLERTFVPLLGAGLGVLWLLTAVVVVQPYEHVIIERFGRQLNPGGKGAGGEPLPAPLGPGLHLKWPWPFEIARPYNTGQLHQISVGWKIYDAEPAEEPNAPGVLLWTDEKHKGLEHFNLLTCPPPRPPDRDVGPRVEIPSDESAVETRRDTPFNVVRLEVAVQYRLKPEALGAYTQRMRDTDRTIRDVAWEEVTRLAASSTVDFLLSQDVARIGDVLRRALADRMSSVGIDVVYVGVTNVHPETSVAQAYREVIGAQQQSVAAIREARVVEDQRLSAVAGDTRTARLLADVTSRATSARERLNAATQQLRGADAAVVEQVERQLDALEPLLRERAVAVARREQAADVARRVTEDLALGLGQSLESQARALEVLRQAEAAEQAAEAALEAQLAPVRAAAVQRLGAARAAAALAAVAARVESTHWESELNRALDSPQLGGSAAATVAAALADRWQIEMAAAGEFARVENEREAYTVARHTYRTRRLMETLAEGLHDARKYFLAFDPAGREVRVRFIAEDERGDILDLTRTQLPMGGAPGQ